ncbi:WD40 repeat-like protein [Basidiobolus meristosporus CBS 931.73]|uniref:Autophagy-related protein 18 n=1 Tax=Basidiobolus meristosporus CBS 931.73 TaxID=1314790 RepID=A0A1Y1YDW7_9FUNG|nr:WD40 repeat-like protein [Basidiobolus meristosporus CBS 931.73]|eukprot:ORX96135.1 WD40 repeat-like protein [Basidiobolus meristosporus CBS 931.73]
MNLGNKSNNELLFLNFNQDFSCISAGTRNGYKIYNCDPFGKCYSKSDGGVGVVEMLFCTSLVALVGAGEQPAFSPRRLQIANTKRESTICELTFPTTILAVKLNRRRLVVILEEQIYVYDISNMKLLHIIETSPNPHAVCALSPSNDNCYLVYPSPSPSPSSPFSSPAVAASHGSASGDILCFDTISLQNVNYIQAHKSPVSCISVSSDGTMVATASDKGTVIRVFSLPNFQRLYQFRRGSYPAHIYSISFNIVSTLLSVSSDTETVHIFKLSKNDENGGRDGVNGDEPGQRLSRRHTAGSGVASAIRRTSFHKKIAGNVGALLPDALTEMWEPARDFAYLKLPSAGVHSIVAISSSTPQVMVVTSDGYLYQYNIDLENGGECVLTKQYSLLDSQDDFSAE